MKFLIEVKPNQNYLMHFYKQKSNINVSNPVDIANKFNEYFINVSPQLPKKFLTTITYHLKATLMEIMPKVCFWQCFHSSNIIEFYLI